jgi:predicted AlkP superfamily pyrophosphatase or phosphodiesterase
VNKIINIFSLIATILTANGLRAQQTVETPKLVISILVDQLRGDYLQYFSPTFGEKGFKRLMNEGLVYHQVDFGFPNLNEASSTATVYTGTYPFYHGICSELKYNRDQKRKESIISDRDYIGNYTSDKFSPLVLLCSTFGDELKKATEGRSNIFSIAPNADQAVLSAGRYANAAFWLDDYNGKWATTTYYKEIPWYVERFNTDEAMGNFSEKTWTQLHTAYTGFSYFKNVKSFNYVFNKSDNERFIKIKQTPVINTEITNLASKFIEYGGFGSHYYPDFLMLTYYAGDYKYGNEIHSEFGYEIQDIYCRLDKELEKLFDLVEKKVGLKNALIVLTSTGYYDSNVQPSPDYKPFGEFYFDRCTALLNMFLMATYGQGDWVTGDFNNQIYLNKKLVEEKQLDLSDFTIKAAEFVAQFSGVQDVTTIGEWLIDDVSHSADYRRGMNKKYSGDLFVELQPGWVVSNGSSNKPPYERNTALLNPLFFWGNHIEKGQVHRKVKATEIAPTLSFVLRIRPPNGAKEMPLQEFIK